MTYLVQLLWWTLGLNLLKFRRPGASQAVHACLFGMSFVPYILTIVVAVRQGGMGEDLFKSTKRAQRRKQSVTQRNESAESYQIVYFQTIHDVYAATTHRAPWH
jgi:hypothetical protein